MSLVEPDAERAVLLRAGEGEPIFDQPERTIRILADRDELALTWFRYEPGQEGPEPHVHRRHTDAFYVLDGELEVGLGPDVKRMTGTAGTLAAAPPSVVHTFRNASDAPVAFLNIHAPGMGFAEMLRAARDGRDADAEEFDQFEPPADGGRPLSDALLRGPGEGEPIVTGGSIVLSKADGSDIDGFFSLAETVLAPGFRGPLRAGDGALVAGFYLLEGTLSLRLGDEKLEVRSGDLALARTNRALATVGSESVRMLNLMAPAPSEPDQKQRSK